ncbi:MAG: class I SAM-dependent methyltransferase [Candidatus Solibacter usitatus]|nr:class I SAM-dependent methyltransferase [Candidatus Solibacter usitatus]
MNPAEYDNLTQAEESMWWFRGMRRILFALLDPQARRRHAARALDVGCGTGAMARALESRYGWRVTGADLSHAGLLKARRAGQVDIVECDALRLPFAACAFDALVSLDMLVHLAPGQETVALGEFARVLAPGGLMALRVAAFHSLRSRHSTFVGERQRFRGAPLLRAAATAGFRPLRSTYANSLLLPVALAKFRLWEPLLHAPVSSSVKLGPAWLEHLLYAPLAMESALIGARLRLPVGQSFLLIAEKA